ncbi:nucleoside recognition domain-containing protein [Motiliproteus sp. SC1-56]|uniref:nucleoside recognition domain-containing protein n=1 Tax=Motiliproteus sp. SC1-56 TaxID=2799565 RepID=UPI001A8E80FA|nr:nucleoside recognition domain-containing protein [Motiliproteus sp. SC1-56]
MADIAALILDAGRAGIELALFVLLPVMIVMLAIMRLLEHWGVLDRVVRVAAPVLRPLGIPGLGVFAMIQILLVSFAAPVATLAMMDRGGVSQRHIAATLAMVLALAQANVVFPMAAVGLNVWGTLLISLLCSLLAAALTYHLFGRHLNAEDQGCTVSQSDGEGPTGLLGVINRAGRDAFEISIGALPMLVLALVVVYVLRAVGLIEALESTLAPLFSQLGLPGASLLPIISKFIAGGTAMMGVAVDYIHQGLISAADFNRLAGLLIHPLDLAGIAVLAAAGRRVAGVLRPALWGAVVAIALRTLLHGLLF